MRRANQSLGTAAAARRRSTSRKRWWRKASSAWPLEEQHDFTCSSITITVMIGRRHSGMPKATGQRISFDSSRLSRNRCPRTCQYRSPCEITSALPILVDPRPRVFLLVDRRGEEVGHAVEILNRVVRVCPDMARTVDNPKGSARRGCEAWFVVDGNRGVVRLMDMQQSSVPTTTADLFTRTSKARHPTVLNIPCALGCLARQSTP